MLKPAGVAMGAPAGGRHHRDGAGRLTRWHRTLSWQARGLGPEQGTAYRTPLGIPVDQEAGVRGRSAYGTKARYICGSRGRQIAPHPFLLRD